MQLKYKVSLKFVRSNTLYILLCTEERTGKDELSESKIKTILWPEIFANNLKMTCEVSLKQVAIRSFSLELGLD